MPTLEKRRNQINNECFHLKNKENKSKINQNQVERIIIIPEINDLQNRNTEFYWKSMKEKIHSFLKRSLKLTSKNDK